MSPKIRLVRDDDTPALLEIYAPIVRETAISFELAPPDLAQYRERIRLTLERLPWLVCEDRAAILGFAYASPFRARAAYQWSVETTVYVSPKHQRRGVARGLYAALLGCLNLQGFTTAIAVIALPNAASAALHESMGFCRVGMFESIGYKLDRWHDVGVWCLQLRDRPQTPAPPRAILAWEGSAELTDIFERAAGAIRRP